MNFIVSCVRVTKGKRNGSVCNVTVSLLVWDTPGPKEPFSQAAGELLKGSSQFTMTVLLFWDMVSTEKSCNWTIMWISPILWNFWGLLRNKWPIFFSIRKFRGKERSLKITIKLKYYQTVLIHGLVACHMGCVWLIHNLHLQRRQTLCFLLKLLNNFSMMDQRSLLRAPQGD